MEALRLLGGVNVLLLLNDVNMVVLASEMGVGATVKYRHKEFL